MRYLIVIHKDADSDYGMTVPDLPGCFSAGETLDDAMIQVVEVINFGCTAVPHHINNLTLKRYTRRPESVINLP